MYLQKEFLRRPNAKWSPFSKLRPIGEDISQYGYDKAYINAHQLYKKMSWIDSSGTGRHCYYEPLEVAVIKGNVFFREHDEPICHARPKKFTTQFGVFDNYNHGEFESWLGEGGRTWAYRQRKTRDNLYGKDGFFIEGNYVDVFDCGKYTYAISNLMHMGLGHFKIVWLDEHLSPINLYNTESDFVSSISLNRVNNSGFITTCLEYAGRFPDENGWYIIASGETTKHLHTPDKSMVQKRTLLFYVDNTGNCRIKREFDVRIPEVNSFVLSGSSLYFGHNKMVSRLDLSTGALEFYTNKSDDELKALSKMI